MSERTAESIAILDRLLPLLESLPSGPNHDELTGATEALRRAVAAFHMEAIRFRMHAVDRLLKRAGDPAEARATFDQLRDALERAGFHTRSHQAPG